MAEKLSIWFTVTYIPGKENLDPVGKSHKKRERSGMDTKQIYIQENFTTFFI